MRSARLMAVPALLAAALAGTALAAATAAEWPNWRGPGQSGVSPETGLVSKWSPEGENLAWKADIIGRSTPVVFDGRVCANGRIGDGLGKQETVACFDAGTGKELWRRNLDVYLTTVPFNRVGWANVVGDPETGYLYAHGVAGLLVAFDRAGKTVWQRSLTEELGLQSGFGGRTHSPMVDEDRLVLSFISAGWGEQAPPRHRTFAFDKKTGDLLWVATPGGQPYDLNTSTTPVAAMIDGRRLLIEGHADGWVYALKARTGEKVWGFQLTKGGINTTVAVAGTTVFAAHSEENVDTAGVMGRVVAIDATGKGDVTKTHEVWRANELGAGFPSPLHHEGRLYVVDNSANLVTLDAKSGKELWRHKLGTVGKGSPAWADGKLYVAELNGRFHILKPGPSGVESLDVDEISVADSGGTRYAEIYGSPAVAYGRVYFASEAGLFCLGDKSKPFKVAKSEPGMLKEEPAPAGAAPAALLVVPAEVLVEPGEIARFSVRAFDDKGRSLPAAAAGAAEWALQGLAGKVAEGAVTPDPARGSQAGKVTAKMGNLEAAARVRVVAPLPWSEDFESYAAGATPAWWIGAGRKFPVKEAAGGKVLAKPPVEVGLDRSDVYMGPPDLSGYTIQADVLGTARGRRRPDVGVINSGYIFDLMGGHQKVQLRSWSSELRLEKSVPFAWQPDVWYTLKLRVDQQGDKALVRGKVWKRGDPEPGDWTITAEDPRPIRSGTPGIYGYSAAEIYYDNLKVTGNDR